MAERDKIALSAVYVDTHIVEWLAQGKWKSKLTARAKRFIDNAETVLVSPMVLLELEYLRQTGRMSTPPADAIIASLGFEVCSLSFAKVALAALSLAWTRDPFDRLIVANAYANGLAPLITADEHIQTNYGNSIW